MRSIATSTGLTITPMADMGCAVTPWMSMVTWAALNVSNTSSPTAQVSMV